MKTALWCLLVSLAGALLYLPLSCMNRETEAVLAASRAYLEAGRCVPGVLVGAKIVSYRCDLPAPSYVDVDQLAEKVRAQVREKR